MGGPNNENGNGDFFRLVGQVSGLLNEATKGVKNVAEDAQNAIADFTGENAITLNMIEQKLKEGDSSVVADIKKTAEGVLQRQKSNGGTLLHFAVFYENTEASEALLKKGLGINDRTKIGNSPVDVAAMKGNWDLITFLIRNGADVTKNTYKMAADAGHQGLLQQIADLGLVSGIQNKDYNKCSEFINLNANVIYTTKKGQTLLEIAATQDDPQPNICKLLIKNDAVVNDEWYDKLPENAYIRKALATASLERALEGSNAEEARKWISKGAEITEDLINKAPENMKLSLEEAAKNASEASNEKIKKRMEAKRRERVEANERAMMGAEDGKILEKENLSDPVQRAPKTSQDILNALWTNSSESKREDLQQKATNDVISSFVQGRVRIQSDDRKKSKPTPKNVEQAQPENLSSNNVKVPEGFIESIIPVDQTQRLIDAIKNENLAEAKEAIKAGVNNDYKGKSIIRYAAEYGDTGIYQYLLNKGVKITADDINNSQSQTLKILAMDGLKQAIKDRDKNLCKLCIDKGAEVTQDTLGIAKDAGNNKEIVAALNEARAKANEAKEAKEAKVSVSEDKSEYEARRDLNERKIDIDIDLLSKAFSKEGLKGVKAMISTGEVEVSYSKYLLDRIKRLPDDKKDIKNYYCNVVLLQSAKAGNELDCKELIEEGADVNAHNIDDDRKTALHYAVEQNNTGLCDFLIKNGADVNAADKEGRTSITEAIKRKFAKIVDIIMGTGKVDEKQPDRSGKTVLDCVLESDSDEIKQIFKKYKPLSYSAKKIAKGVKGLFVHSEKNSKGVRNVPNNKGRTTVEQGQNK